MFPKELKSNLRDSGIFPEGKFPRHTIKWQMWILFNSWFKQTVKRQFLKQSGQFKYGLVFNDTKESQLIYLGVTMCYGYAGKWPCFPDAYSCMYKWNETRAGIYFEILQQKGITEFEWGVYESSLLLFSPLIFLYMSQNLHNEILNGVAFTSK